MIKTIKNYGYSQDNALNPMFEDMLNHLPDIFFLFNQEGRFLLWNKKLEQISEYIPDEISNMNPLDFFSSEDKQLITEKINLAFKDGFASVEKALKTKTGNKIPYLFTASSIYYKQQNCLIGMGVDISINNAMSDITHHKEYESSLKHLNATLEKQSEELLQHINEIEAQNLKLKEIAWIQSHEVRAPLASLMGLVSLFDNNMISEVEKDQLFIKLGNAAKELDQVITSIILKTRFDLGNPSKSQMHF